MFFNEYVAIDITGSEIRLLSIQRSKIRKWAAEPLKEGLVKDGIILEPQTLGLIIDNLFKSSQVSRDRVICTVTGLPFIYRTIAMPDTDVINKESLQRAARKEMSLAEPDMYLLWQLMEAHLEKKELDYFVLAVPRHSINPLSEALKQAHIKLFALDVKPLALARAVSASEAFVISLEKGYVDITVISGGIARVLHSFLLDAKIRGAQATAMEVANGLSKAEKSYNREYPQNPLPAETPVILSGELGADKDILTLLQQTSGHPVSLISSPFELPPEVDPARYAANLGLILKKLPPKTTGSTPSRYKDVNLDLFSVIRKPSALRFREGYIFLLMGFIIVAALLYYSYYLQNDATRKADALRSQSTALTAQLNQAQKVNKTNLAEQKTASDALNTVQKQLDTLAAEHQYISGLHEDYASWVEYITKALPDHCRYDKINLGKDVINVTGTADYSTLVLTFTFNLENNGKISAAVINSIDPAGTAQSSMTTGAVSFNINIKR